MFNAISRYIRPGSTSTESDSPIDKGKQRASPTPTETNVAAIPMARKPSSVLMNRSRSNNGPPQISWLNPANQASGSSWGLGLSAAPSQMPSPASIQEPAQSRPSLSGSRAPPLKRISSESLYLRLTYLSQSDSNSVSSLVPSDHNKPLPLSPINERAPRGSPLRRASLESGPQTPQSQRTFLTRPLKRSVSQTSTSTLLSVASQAPSIPPVDIRPNFYNTALSGGPSRKLYRATPTLPTVIGSPRPNVSVIYENSSKSRSFKTAHSNRTSNRTSGGSSVELVEYDQAPEEEDIAINRQSLDYPVEYFNTDSETSSQADAQEEEERRRMEDSGVGVEGQQEAPYDEVDLASPIEQGGPISSSNVTTTNTTSGTFTLSKFPLPPRQPALSSSSSGSLPSRRATSTSHHSAVTSVSATSTAVETAIQQRWLKGLSFGSAKFVWEKGPKMDMKVTSACILFWIGFIAPWCWLIGGWYLAPNGEMLPDGQYLKTVDLQWPRRDRKYSNPLSTAATAPTTAVTTSTRPAGRFGKMKKSIGKRWDAFLHCGNIRDSGADILPMSASSSTLFPCLQVDPWVVKCRIAAVVGGIIIFVAFIIALIVLAGIHRL